MRTLDATAHGEHDARYFSGLSSDPQSVVFRACDRGCDVLFASLGAGDLTCRFRLLCGTNRGQKERFVHAEILPADAFHDGIINPAFNHAGATILCYLPTGNPLTLESILYGFSAGAMLATVLLWFRSFHRVMTSDKFIHLLGRVIPAMSLVLSMTLRFIPKFKNQLDVVTDAQRSIGKDVSSGSLWQRTKTAITILSITVTWALENAIESADSMKSRGYGLKGRSSFSIYQFDERDFYLALWLGFCGFYILCGVLESAFGFRYFPSVRYASLNSMTIPFYLIYLAMCMTPVMLNASEAKKWKIIYSSM